jgi:hypothetical protein
MNVHNNLAYTQLFTILIHIYMYTLTYIYVFLYILIIRILYTQYITHSGHTCTVDIVTVVIGSIQKYVSFAKVCTHTCIHDVHVYTAVYIEINSYI